MILWGDQIMLCLTLGVLADRPGATIIADVKASQVLFDGITQAGGRPLMWKTGHSLIKAKMREEDAPFAGEMSGHLFFADRYYGYDDALYAALRLLGEVARSGSAHGSRGTNHGMPHSCNAVWQHYSGGVGERARLEQQWSPGYNSRLLT